jgi:hypothetical protein
MKSTDCGLLHGESRSAVERLDAPLRAHVAAGGPSLPIFQRLLAEGRIARGSLRLLAQSAPIPESLRTFRSGLPTDPRDAFVGLRDPGVLRAYWAEAFCPSVDTDVDQVRYWMQPIRETRPQSAACQHDQAPTAAVATAKSTRTSSRCD